MSQEKHRIPVSINNQTYTLIGSENPEHLRYIAHRVDEKIKDIGRKSPGLDTTRKSVLAAVNIMDDYVKLQDEYEALKVKLESQGNNL